MEKVTITFDTEKQAQDFMSWMCEAGEQWYWL